MAKAQLPHWFRRYAERALRPPPQTQAPPRCLAIRQEVYFTPPDLDFGTKRGLLCRLQLWPLYSKAIFGSVSFIIPGFVGVILHAPNERKKKDRKAAQL